MPEHRTMVRSAAMTLILILVLAPSVAEAHKLKAFAFVEGATIRGLVFFGRAAPAQGVSVVISAPDGSVLAKTVTDSEGRFVFDAVRRIDHHISVDSGDGHSATYVVTAAELPATLPDGSTGSRPAGDEGRTDSSPPPVPSVVGTPAVPAIPLTTAPGTDGADGAVLAALVETAVARQLGPLREQLAVFEERVLLRDALGGLGYIVGLTGLVLWFRAGRAGTRR